MTSLCFRWNFALMRSPSLRSLISRANKIFRSNEAACNALNCHRHTNRRQPFSEGVSAYIRCGLPQQRAELPIRLFGLREIIYEFHEAIVVISATLLSILKLPMLQLRLTTAISRHRTMLP